MRFAIVNKETKNHRRSEIVLVLGEFFRDRNGEKIKYLNVKGANEKIHSIKKDNTTALSIEKLLLLLNV